MTTRRRILPIVRAAITHAPASTRRAVFWLFVAWGALMAGQVWDVWGRSGPAATAELLSVIAGATGIVLLGTTQAIGAGSHFVTGLGDDGRDDLRPVLLALPLLAFVAGTLLSAAIALFIARGLLGVHIGRVVVIATMHLAALLLAWVTIRDTTRLLFAEAERRGAQALQARADLAEARMSALQARMQPHVLFNTLNTIASLIGTDPAAAEATVEDLSELLRSVLRHGSAPSRSLREELTVVRAYLAIEQRRLGPRLSVDWEIPAALLDAQIPSLSLQPIVENAIKHGIAERIDGGHVLVRGTATDGALSISVADDGDGFVRGWSEGTGLGDLRQRLQTLYGARASLTIGSAGGAIVTVTVPMTETLRS